MPLTTGNPSKGNWIEWIAGFKQRTDLPEMMDDPALAPSALREALADIRWVNRSLNGTNVLLHHASMIIDAHDHQPHYKILDLGTGSADIPMALAKWAKEERNISVHITAVDNNPETLTYGKEVTAAYPNIYLRQGDAFALDEPDGAYDLVISSMFMHHLSDADAVRLMLEMHRLSRLGWVINDLERHPLAFAGIWTLGKLTQKGQVFMHDAPLSVRRGFTVGELLQLEREAMRQAGEDFGRVRILRQWPFRLIMRVVK